MIATYLPTPADAPVVDITDEKTGESWQGVIVRRERPRHLRSHRPGRHRLALHRHPGLTQPTARLLLKEPGRCASCDAGQLTFTQVSPPLRTRADATWSRAV